MRTALPGILPSGSRMVSDVINAVDFQKYVMSKVAALAGAGKISSGDSLVLQRLNQVRANVYAETKNAATYVPGMANLPAITREFDKSYFDTAATLALECVEARMDAVALKYDSTLGTSGNAQVVRATLGLLYNNPGNIKVPKLDTPIL
ncbi:hypothetical protein BO71DRAFT_436432 [Aspergillus ellipticus CBS 707.79]|uniref:Uncharacterized protein n=1 Tax=Aspergillus ellipticus CBS 707.79 TaxID=1448320 RepID=A0A319CZF1_9EURO|nr:hypothetical protein BO71DRAFT_436432 [Aspergillus ellipticus CBS 707.79]